MLKRMTVAALAVLAGVAGAHAQNQTEVVIQYPYPELFWACAPATPASTASAATVILFNIDISFVVNAPGVYLMPVSVMPSMNRRWASRNAMRSGVMMTMAAAISGP